MIWTPASSAIAQDYFVGQAAYHQPHHQSFSSLIASTTPTVTSLVWWTQGILAICLLGALTVMVLFAPLPRPASSSSKSLGGSTRTSSTRTSSRRRHRQRPPLPPKRRTTRSVSPFVNRKRRWRVTDPTVAVSAPHLEYHPLVVERQRRRSATKSPKVNVTASPKAMTSAMHSKQKHDVPPKESAIQHQPDNTNLVVVAQPAPIVHRRRKTSWWKILGKRRRNNRRRRSLLTMVHHQESHATLPTSNVTTTKYPMSSSSNSPPSSPTPYLEYVLDSSNSSNATASEEDDTSVSSKASF